MVNVGGSQLNKADPLLRLYLLLKRNCTSLLHHAHQHESLPSGSAMDNKLIELVSTFNNDKDGQMEIVLQLATLFDQCVFYLCNIHNMSAGMVSVSVTDRTELRHPSNNNNSEVSEEDTGSVEGTGSKGIRELVQLAITFKGFEKIARVVGFTQTIITTHLSTQSHLTYPSNTTTLSIHSTNTLLNTSFRWQKRHRMLPQCYHPVKQS